MAEQAPPAPAPAVKSDSITSTTGTPSTPPGTQGPPQQGGIENLLVMMIPMFIIFYLLIIRPQKKEQKAREELMAKLKPKDRVVTVFGLHGTVAEIDGDEVVLLVDAKKDVKLRFRRTAIDTILAEKE